MGTHSGVTHERINKQLNYEGYGLIRYHFCRLPVEHDRGSASLPPGPPVCCHLLHCRRSRPHSCFWSHRHHPHRCPAPRSGCQESGSPQDPCRTAIDGIFFLFCSFKSKSKTKIRNKKKLNPKKKKKKKKKKK